MAVSEVVAVAILVVGMVVALWLLVRSVRGRPRVLGILGTALILLGLLSHFAYQWTIQRYLGRVDDQTIISVLAAEIAVGGLLTGAGLIVVARAIVVAGDPPKTS